MSRPRDETPKSCPLCGESDVLPPTSCKLCGGTKLVTRATWARWSNRPPAKSTSTTIDMRAIAAGRLVEMKELFEKVRPVMPDPREADHAEKLIADGTKLISVIDSWKKKPADGKERSDHYQRVNHWLEQSMNALRAMRRL